MRVDASCSIGTGHVMRCLALARTLRRRGMTVEMACRPLPGQRIALLQEAGFPVAILPFPGSGATRLPGHPIDAQEQARDAELCQRVLEPVDWIIVDHYNLDFRWHQALRTHARRIMVIDDLADRRLDCDLLLNPNPLPDLETRYAGLLPQHCRSLLGLRYFLFREEFLDAIRQVRRPRPQGHILVFFSGTDPTRETWKTALALSRMPLPATVRVEFILNRDHQDFQRLARLCRHHRHFRLATQVPDMARRMLRAQFAIGSGGSAAGERCLLGLPTLAWQIAENQREVLQDLTQSGAIRFLGESGRIKAIHIGRGVQWMLDHPWALQLMRQRARRKFQGPPAGSQAVASELTCLLETGSLPGTGARPCHSDG